MGYEIKQLNGMGMESNSYLILGSQPALIDVGTGARLKDEQKQLKAWLEGGKLHRLVLTHMHFDHTGGAAALQALTGAESFAHPPDSKALADGDDTLTCSGWLGEKQRPLKINAVKEGDIIVCGDVRLEVLHTPGHTAGSICLWDRGARNLFSGDTVFANGGVGRWDLPTGDHGALVSSLERLLELDVRGLYPGHGPFYEDGGRAHIEMGLSMARDLGD